jgi:crotonobetainyl-CoA:carnitine CoA-transferase CaiB-like acyl-CoA transferase
MSKLPLEGITVLEFSQYLAGPYAGLRLADLGARVIKVERPNGGDACRQLATKNMTLDGDSLVFHTVNRNKESFTADLKNADDLEKVKQLIATADVMTHNFRPGVMEKIGLDYQQVAQINPNIVYGEVSGYGKHGPWAKKPGQDLLAQAASGLTWLTGDNKHTPIPFGMAIADMLCGTHFAQGLLAALVRQARTGHGAHIEVSLLESLMDFQFEVLTSALNSRNSLSPQRAATQEHAHTFLDAPYGIFASLDGHIALAMGDLRVLAQAIELPALADFFGNSFDKRDDINRLLRTHLKTQTNEYWLSKLIQIDFWCAPVLNYHQLIAEKNYQLLEMEQTVRRPNGSQIKTLRCPIRINGKKLYSQKASPSLGEGNLQIEKMLAQSQKTAPDLESHTRNELPLAGITVLDFSQFLSGPSASLRLADLGARVIKVEQPITGDICRNLYSSPSPIDGTSPFFCAINRNKESISIDLKDSSQHNHLERLVKDADVVLHNFRPGVAERLGIDQITLKQINPNLIYGEISGYGTTGTWADLPGQDLLLQGISGLSWLSGNQNDGPIAMGLPVVDVFSGAQLAQGILALLYERQLNGNAGSAEVVMLESALDFQFEPLTIYFQDGGEQPIRTQTNSAHSLLGAPYGVYQTKDGYLALAMGNLNTIAELISCDTLSDFSTAASWFDERDEIKRRLAQHLVSEPTEIWLTKLEPSGVWCARVHDWVSIRATEAYKNLDMEQAVTTSSGTNYLTLRCPIRLDGAVIKSPLGAPSLGEHNAKNLLTN